MLEKLNEIHARLARETANFNDHLSEEGFVKNCMDIIESGWRADFDNIESLRPFMITTDPIENLFVRRYLLKRLLQAHAEKHLRYFDAEWFTAAEENLTHEYNQSVVRESWSDILCNLEPRALLFFVMFYLLAFTKRGTHSPLVTISLAALPAAYAALTGLDVVPSGTYLVRSYFRTPALRQAEARKTELYNIMNEPHTRRPVQERFWFNGNPQNPIMPQTLLEKVAEVYENLSLQTARFNTYKDTDGFIENCFDLVKNGWKNNFIHSAGLVPFEATKDTLENTLKRLYLAKLLSELHIDDDECASLRQPLLKELKQHIEKSYRALRYQNRPIREDNIDNLHYEGTAQLNRWQPSRLVVPAALALDLLIKYSNQNSGVTVMLIALLVTGTSAKLVHNCRQSYAGERALLFADNNHKRLSQYGVRLLNHEGFISKFLDQRAEPHSAKPRTTADEACSLIEKNSMQALIGGVALFLFGLTNNGFRSASTWAGFALMAASILFYNEQRVAHTRRAYGP